MEELTTLSEHGDWLAFFIAKARNGKNAKGSAGW
jgi:hypothetical protein